MFVLLFALSARSSAMGAGGSGCISTLSFRHGSVNGLM
jgi:hypothetical protein